MIKYKLIRCSDDMYHEDERIFLINVPAPCDLFIKHPK